MIYTVSSLSESWICLLNVLLGCLLLGCLRPLLPPMNENLINNLWKSPPFSNEIETLNRKSTCQLVATCEAAAQKAAERAKSPIAKTPTSPPRQLLRGPGAVPRSSSLWSRTGRRSWKSCLPTCLTVMARIWRPPKFRQSLHNSADIKS